jgi:hypothetical protein
MKLRQIAARTLMYTLFKIDSSWGFEVLLEVLGKDFNGILGFDCFSPYPKYMKEAGVLLRFCLEHLIRNVKFFTTLPYRARQNYGNRLLEGPRGLFRVIHRRERLTEESLQRALVRERKRYTQFDKAAPPRTEARKIA